jgi:hypothetical protein
MNSNVVRVNVAGRFYDTPQFVVTNIIRPILQSFILPFYGIKTLHGAIVSRDDRTVFLMGRGGMGKTTTALQLMRAGYEVLSDDGPLFFVDRGEPYVASSLDYLHLTQNTLSLFPELRRHRVGIADHRDKFCIKLGDVQPASILTRPRRVTHCIRLNRRSDFNVPRIIRIPNSIVHRELVDESMTVFRRLCFREDRRFALYVEFVFELLSRIVQQIEAFDLEFADRHLADIPRIVDGL